jgi:hypothetical protein
MSLLSIWTHDKQQLLEKNIQQIIAFAGEGSLHDGNTTSIEFREFLRNVPSDLIELYAHQCLDNAFKGSGFVLQDIVNEIGSRLGFTVIPGRYQGKQGLNGFDGLWTLESGHNIIAEVKTTDAYRFALDTIAAYRESLVDATKIRESNSSVLIIVGREDTGDLEAQIRGSRHAWSMRLISIEALLRLMTLKQQIEDPAIIKRMNDILIPREFTKLDEIIDIVFSTSEDIKEEEPPEVQNGKGPKEDKPEPVAYHQQCVKKVETRLHKTFVTRSKVLYSTQDKQTALVCMVSREYGDETRPRYWFGFHTYQIDFLKDANEAYVAFGCGTENTLFVIPFKTFLPWLADMNTTTRGARTYWHVHIYKEKDGFTLKLKNNKNINLNGFQF